MAGAMLGMGLLVAGAVVAVVLLEFDRLDEVGRTVAIAGLVVLSGIAMWAYVQTIRTRGELGMVTSPAQSPEPGVARQLLADRPERSELVPEALAPRQGDPEPARPSEPAHGGGEPEQATADRDSRKEEASEERDAGSGHTVGTGATEPESDNRGRTRAESGESGKARPGISEPRAPDPSAVHDSVVEAWRQYLRHGDGHFNVVGFRRELSTFGLQLSVTDGARVQAGETVLLVEGPSHPVGRFLVVPNFMKSPRAAPDWFEDMGDGALTRRTRTVHRLGEGEWTGAGFKVIEKGRIE